MRLQRTSVNVKTYRVGVLDAIVRILRVLAAMLGNANSSSFLAPLRRVDPVPTLGGDT
jgi:hypothetical protein